MKACIIIPCYNEEKRIDSKVNSSLKRHYLGRVWATLVSLLLGLPTYDTQCGAKIINRDLAAMIFKEPFVSPCFFDVELLFRIKKEKGVAFANTYVYGYSPEVSPSCSRFVFAETNNNMSKNTEIKFVGQPIFNQILNLVDAVNIQSLVMKHYSEYYYKAYRSRKHLITMLFGILSRCDSMTEICEGMRTLGGKLNHPVLKSAFRHT